MVLQNKTIKNERIVVTDKEPNMLGPKLTVKNCDVVLQVSARGLGLNDVEFIDCTITAKKKLVNFQRWCSCYLKGCTFGGTFSGNDFGGWPDEGTKGSIEACNFSAAILDACRFIDCQMDGIILPSWPSFAILRPLASKKKLEAMTWPGKLYVWVKSIIDEPELTTAIVDYAPRLAKDYGVSQDELRRALERFGGVLM